LFGQYHFDSWTTDNGLPQNGVRDITQTPDGYLWFTTFDGLVRFDGVRFTTLGKGNTKGIINNRFTNLYSDKNGTIFASTMEDGILTVLQNGVFSSYTSDQVPGDYIRKIDADKNGEPRFLILDKKTDSDSLYYLRDGKFVLDKALNKNNIKVEYQGKSGTLWTIEKDKIRKMRDGKETIFSYQVGNYDSTLEVFEDSFEGLWIGGKKLIHITNDEIESFDEKDGFPFDADFHSLWQESDGSVWFANGGQTTSGVGLVRYKDGVFSHFGAEVGLSNSSIYGVLKDREGTVWVGTNKGLNRLRKDVIKTYSTKDGLPTAEVYPLYRDSKENIWIGTINGLVSYHDGKFEDIKLRQTRQDVSEHTKWKNGKMSVQSILEDKNGKMWLGVSGGIFIADNGQTEMIPESESHHVYSIQEDKAGNIWTATSKGILRFNDYKLTAFYSKKDGLPNDFMTVIHEDSKGRLWFGGLGGLTEFKDGKFINYTVNEGLTGNYVRSIYEDADGTLWIGTYDEGLSRFKDGQFFNYKAENGLYNNGVFAIEEDNRGNFWISSNNGIYRVKRQVLNDFADGKISKINSIGYGKEDGMLNSECNGGRQPASLKDKDGKFWFPTQDGVVVVDPELETHNTMPPSVVIESATVEREAVDIKNGLTIEPGQKNVEIKFTGISLVKSEQVKFKYKLEEHDTDWIDGDTRRTAYYSYLPPGNYQFRVKAANSDGIWNEEGATLNLELKPFFYQTRWFYLLCTAIGIFALFVIWKISVYQLESREKYLAKLVSEKTEELRKANEELQQLANSDGLTGVGNRRLFEEFLADEWLRAIRFKTEISMILLDIDYFKLFNDTYGHQVGDNCLKRVAKALRKTTHRPTDIVARYGGEEFAIILGRTDSAGALSIAEKAIENIRKLKISHESSKTSDFLTVSIGVATISAEFGMTESELIKAADDALYQAKENGRNQIIASDLTLKMPEISILDQEYIDID
jgi:diguanylate cyclase (GGDEF)-like protein